MIGSQHEDVLHYLWEGGGGIGRGGGGGGAQGNKLFLAIIDNVVLYGVQLVSLSSAEIS